MERVLSTLVLRNHRLTSVWLDRIWDAGIPKVEVLCARQHFDYQNQAQVTELAHWFRDAPVKMHSLHSPVFSDDVNGRSGPDAVLDITEPNKARRIAIIDEIKRAIETVELIPCQFLVQHLGVKFQEMDERRADCAFTSLEEIVLFARHRGVEVLLENIQNEYSSSERLNWFNGQTHLNLNYCFDIGHAHLMESVSDAYEAMKPRIRSTHIHDNNGTDDSHQIPESGTIDWRKAMRLLRSADGQYPLLLELREQPDVENPIELAQRAFDRLENLGNPEEDK